MFLWWVLVTLVYSLAVPVLTLGCLFRFALGLFSQGESLAFPGSLLRPILNSGGVRTGSAPVFTSSFSQASDLHCLNAWLMFSLSLVASCSASDTSSVYVVS